MSPPRILLVEDEAIIAFAVAFELELAGYAVTTAPNGREALRSLQTAKPDVIITDFMMPHMDGGELIRRIRAMDGLGSIPIVVVSAITEENLRGRVDGYTAYMPKPVRDNELLDLLESLLAKRGRPR
jgi:CheY-like chemotaxis protein